MLEARLGESSSTQQSNHAGTNPEGLLVMFESLSHGKPPAPTDLSERTTIAPLYQPGRPVFLMLIPDRTSSQQIVNFALTNLSWIHCAIRTKVFQHEHEAFWESIENGNDTASANDHGWLSIYFSLLTVGSLYMDPEERPILPRLNGFEENAGQSGIESERGRHIAQMCHFGQMEQEYLLLGLATNTARALDMHLLASEERFSQRLAMQLNWGTPENRHLGRRLWWTLVICDWLGMFTRPSSISPSSFNTTLSPQPCDNEDLLMKNSMLEITDIPASRFHLTMSRLASVIYINVKAPRDLNTDRFTVVLNQVEKIEESMTRQTIPLSINIPSWVAAQEYLIGNTVQLLSVTMARASLVLWLMGRPNTEPIIDSGLKSALKILYMRQQPVPRLYQCHWIISAATLAAGVYLGIHLICFKEATVSTQVTERRRLIRYCIGTIQYPNASTPLAIRGSQMLEILLQIEIHSPTVASTDKPTVINLLKMAFQNEGPSIDPINEYGTMLPTFLDSSADELGLLWPTMMGDFNLDELLPDMDWGQMDGKW
ncbi:hypothetical protein N7528_004748 [Penicillium herquei]|nr:hypothetical protein N7528_004748 [Penicillium herquei]